MWADEIDTPAVVVDLDRVDRNLRRAQTYADRHGLCLRPHVKTHKLPLLAQRQVALGAIGITCQKLGEAEAMADGGLDDIFLPYNILGAAKLARLVALHRRVRLSVATDNGPTTEGYAAAFLGRDPLTVLVECDTGAGRCGVQTPKQAVALARQIDAAAGLSFGGLMTYPPQGQPAEVETRLGRFVAALQEAGVPPKVVSAGGTPDLMQAALIPSATEYRPGTYVYSDRMQVAWGHGTLDDCAMQVRACVVSRPTPTRAVLDAGSKALAADPVPAPFAGHGHIVEYPEAEIAGLSEEHGVVSFPAPSAAPAIGEIVHVIPNHACVVSNLFDHVHLVRGGQVESIAKVSSRGCLT